MVLIANFILICIVAEGNRKNVCSILPTVVARQLLISVLYFKTLAALAYAFDCKLSFFLITISIKICFLYCRNGGKKKL